MADHSRIGNTTSMYQAALFQCSACSWSVKESWKGNMIDDYTVTLILEDIEKKDCWWWKMIDDDKLLMMMSMMMILRFILYGWWL